MMHDLLMITGGVGEVSRASDWAERRGLAQGLQKKDISDLRRCVESALKATIDLAFQSRRTTDNMIAIAIHFKSNKTEVEILEEGREHHNIDTRKTALRSLSKNWKHDIRYLADSGINRLKLSRRLH